MRVLLSQIFGATPRGNAKPLSWAQTFTAGLAAMSAGRALAAPIPNRPLTQALAAPATLQTPLGEFPITLAADATRLAVIGDFGSDTPAEARVANMVIDFFKPHAVCTSGDNNYPRGEDETFDKNVAKYWHSFIRFSKRYDGTYAARGVDKNAFFPAKGNHDWMGDAFRFFKLPGNGRYYTVRLGAVELFVVDSDPSEPSGVHKHSHQARWLKHALAKSKAQHKIITMHQGPYSTGHHGSNYWMRWPFEKWGATAVIAGHDHFYERIVRKGFPYFVNGAGGAPLDTVFQGGTIPGASEDVTYKGGYGAMLLLADKENIAFCFFSDNRTLVDAYTLPPRRTPVMHRACLDAVAT